MIDFETKVRAVAQRLSAKYQLPTHIVEEDLWHDLKDIMARTKGVHGDLNIKVSALGDNATVKIESDGGVRLYQERQPTIYQKVGEEEVATFFLTPVK
jgi:hypothetical protein